MIINLLKNSNILIKDIFKIKEKVFDSKKHILAWADWLLKSQEVNDDGWYSVKYSILRWWDVSYPETTWYIIPTLYEVYKYTNNKKYYNSILKAWEYLLNIQMENWAWGDSVKWEPAIFDIWQIIFGLVKLYEITNDEKYLQAAKKWWDFIVSDQEEDGSWVKYAFNNQPHTYYSRVSWALLKLWKITNDEKYKNSAIKQLNWVLDQLDENYFSPKLSFFNDWNPVLHTIVYTARWLYESWKILNEEKYIKAWKWIIDKLLEIYKNWKQLYAHYDKNWSTTCKFYCLTWLAQLSILWGKLYQDTNEKDYLFYAIKLNYFVKQTQNITTKNENVRWWIKGSYPIWWKYMIWAYPNWAVKFFIDALLLEERIKKREKIENEKEFFVKENKENFFYSKEFINFLYDKFWITFKYPFFKRFFFHFKLGKFWKILPKIILFSDRLVIDNFVDLIYLLESLKNKKKDISLYLPQKYTDFFLLKYSFLNKWWTFILDLDTFRFKSKIQNKINNLLDNSNYSIKIYDLNIAIKEYKKWLSDYNLVIKESWKIDLWNYLPDLKLYINKVKHFFIIFYNAKNIPIASMLFFYDNKFLYEIDISICYNLTNEKYIWDLLKFKWIEYAKKLWIKYYDLMWFNPNNDASEKEKNIKRYKKKYWWEEFYYLKLN